MIWSFSKRRLNLADDLPEFTPSKPSWYGIELALPRSIMGPPPPASEIDRKVMRELMLSLYNAVDRFCRM